MVRKTIAAALAVLVAAVAAARPIGHDDSYVAREVAAIATEERSKEMGALTFGDIEGWRERIASAAHKDAYIARAGGASFMLPGAGQIKNGQTGLGALLIASHVAIGAGSLLGVHFLLPPDLRLGTLDYLRTPVGTIEASWKSHSLLDYLPAIGVTMAGHLLDMGLRVVASHNARTVARALVESGKADVEARFR